MAQDALITIATRHQSHYERLKAHEVKKFDPFLRKMDRELRASLAGDDITDFTRARMEKKIRQIGALLNGTFNDYQKVWTDSIKDAAIYEAGFESRSLAQVVKGVDFALASDSQIVAAVFNTPLGDIPGPGGGQLLESYFDQESKALVRKVEGAIRSGYAEGQTTEQVIRRIRGTKKANFTDGMWATTKRDIEGVTRTALQHASVQAREEVWTANKSIIKKVRIAATLDRKTSTICRSLDGREYDVDKGPRPPFHIKCRTTTVAVLPEKFKGLSVGRTRSTRDPVTGDVEKTKGTTTYYSWLKGQPANVQNSIIGGERGKLLRNGGLTADRFATLNLDKNFIPRNLDQMKKLEPAAFEKAGLTGVAGDPKPKLKPVVRPLRGDKALESANPKREITGREKETLEAYTKNSRFPNQPLREGTITEGQLRETVAHIDSSFIGNEVSADILSYRGLKESQVIGMSSLGTGSEFVDAGFPSTSSRVSKAEVFAFSDFTEGRDGKKTLLRIKTKKGQTALNLKGFSSFKDEDEILLPRGRKFVIVDRRTTEDHIFIDVERVD